MLFCKPNCVEMTQVDWGKACQLTPKPGGISRLLFIVCDPDYVLKDPYAGWANLENIQQAIADGKFFFSGEVLGQKPKGSFTKKRISSCAPEIKISGVQTITFQDYSNLGYNDDCTIENEYDFWDKIQKKAAFLYLGWLTCDDMMYQAPGQFDVEVGDVIEDSNLGTAYFDGTITFQGLDIIKPCLVTGLNAYLASVTVPTY